MYKWRTQFGNVMIKVLTGHLLGINLELRVAYVYELLTEGVRAYFFKEVKASPSGGVMCMHIHFD